MKKIIFTSLLMLSYSFALSQLSSVNVLNTYPEPPIPPGTIDTYHNNDFSVRARIPGGPWQNLYEYKTFVNSGSTRAFFEASSFVTFDFTGTVELEVTNNWAPIINLITIRPQSKNINYTKTGNTVKFFIHEPVKLSFEINGNRYRNLQIFANGIETLPPASEITKTFHNDIINYLPNNQYNAQDNEVIYFEPGAIIKGKINIIGRDNVKVLGRGIIDITHLEKQCCGNIIDSTYQYIEGVEIRNSTNITLDGFIINDPQHYGTKIIGSNGIDIHNIKIFTRVLWGGGIDVTASSNVILDDCYIRTADDCIAIYGQRGIQWGWPNKDATNIFATNLILYADQAHPIEIGWHGNRMLNNGNAIWNVNFNNIDILEHDEPLGAWQGTIAINCGDENRCMDFKFNNIRVEDFTEGRLINIQVESGGDGNAHTDGKYIRNIAFNNITYNGYGENSSIIKGLSCDRFVNGVHFQDLKINGQYIHDLSDYDFQTNNYAYNITFQAANNYSTSLPSGTYFIKNKGTGKYLKSSNSTLPDDNSAYYTLTSSSFSRTRRWKVINLGTGHYRIRNSPIQSFLHNSREKFIPNCKGRYTAIKPHTVTIRQEWKLVPQGDGYYHVFNVYSRAYLRASLEQNSNSENYVITFPNYPSNNYQKWEFIPIAPLTNNAVFSHSNIF